jgi:hypothetical protein
VAGRKLRAAGQTMDAAHASAVQSKARCSLGSMSARVEIHGLDRASRRPKISWSGRSPDLHNACPSVPGQRLVSFPDEPAGDDAAHDERVAFGELLGGAAGVTANDKGFLAPLWAFARRRGTRHATERCANAAVHTLGRAPNFKRRT